MGARQSSEKAIEQENLQRPYRTEDIESIFRLLFLRNGTIVFSRPVFKYYEVHQATISKIDPNFCNIGHRDSITTYTILDSYEEEYRTVIRKITNRNFKTDRIEKINNPFLQLAFQLKKKQAVGQGVFMHERLLFHGTKAAYIDNICNFNFDWRRIVKHKFGQGVSFSPNSTYASNYSDKMWNHEKVMIVAKVLVGQYCLGTPDMKLPLEGCDTSHNETKQVLVKYEDADYYPAYKITYHMEGQLSQHKKRR